MSGRFLTLKGMAEAKKDEAMLNSMIKRGEIDDDYVSFIPCSCGADHVIPVTRKYKEVDGKRT